MVDEKLLLQIIGGAVGELAGAGINGAVRRGFSARAGDVLQDTVCIYQALVPGRTLLSVEGNADTLRISDWHIRRQADGGLTVDKTSK